jgi:triphosphoribosyl-dephospho-CoA synthetase
VAAAQLACLLGVSVERTGNVTSTHSFHDMSYEDFLRGAAALGPEMARVAERSVGATLVAAIAARWQRFQRRGLSGYCDIGYLLAKSG